MSQVKDFFISLDPPADNELRVQIGSYLLRSDRQHASLGNSDCRANEYVLVFELIARKIG